MKRKNKGWFKPRSFIHISEKIPKEAKKSIQSFVSDEENIATHSFFPLIHETLSARKYKKYYDDMGDVYRSHFDKINNKSSTKKREIFYPNHLDTHIYAYYANEVLGKPYNEKLKEDDILNESIIAYRKIPVGDNSEKNKSNIHFAYDVFEEIKKRENCIVVCYDIENFFPSLNHEYLESCWKKLLEVSQLPPHHSNIFKSITNYSYIEVKDIIAANDNDSFLRLARKQDYRNSDFNSYFISSRDFRDKIAIKNLIKVNKPDKKKGGSELRGIPQGTPLSAFLANLYLLEFDTFIIESFVKRTNCFYRRYSDDILLIFSSIDEFEEYDKIIRDKISADPFSLKIKKEKTTVSIFEYKAELDRIVCQTQSENQGQFKDDFPLRYLGFEFNGKVPLLKSSGLSSYYREMKQTINKRNNRADGAINFNLRQKGKKNPKKSKPENIYLTKAYKRFTHLGKNKTKSNFLTYADRAAEIMYPELKDSLDNPIRKQVRRSWSIFNRHVISKAKILPMQANGPFKKSTSSPNIK